MKSCTFRLSLVSLLMLTGPFRGLAQVSGAASPPAAELQRFNAFGLTTNTNSGVVGGVVLRQTKSLSNHELPRFRYLAAEFVNVRHPSERAYVLTNGNRLILGKQSYLFALRGQWGREFTLFRRAEVRGIELNGILAGGPTLGLLKPYFVQVVTRQAPRQTYEVPYDPTLIQSREVYINGGGSPLRGFDRLNVVPGLNVKAAVAIELDTFQQASIGIETGFLVEGYRQEIVIISGVPNRQFFTSGYLTLYYGTRR
ncbi:hypothetical protein [Aliterella atlantica]|uniref:Uncharacterized protein n=1 Tax=Aliterella atlantica CENA595 TaxID=1618023 RepID=A0A0D8ZQ68_9CYAN|nr:hypothetical protein [Aliterella atlantica]KJH69336.1 hypothetical protein UH38_24465 [Aliterella atlantica CENA595]